jgi:trigger factor
VGGTREFAVTYPAEYEIKELAGATVDYAVTVKGIRRKELLPLDDEFAKEVSDAGNAGGAARADSRGLCRRAPSTTPSTRCRHDLLTELSGGVTTVPEVLVNEEIDRRLEEFVRRLADQGIDPMKAEIDWQEFRERQRWSGHGHGEEHAGGRRSRAARVHRGDRRRRRSGD